MKLNRRNALIGLGTAAAGTGAIFGTGALIQQTINRDIEVSVEDSDGGNVQLPIKPVGNTNNRVELAENNGVDVLQIDATNIPQNATVTFGEFDDDDDGDSMQRGIATIQNKNPLDVPIDITFEFDVESAGDFEAVELAIAKSNSSGGITELARSISAGGHTYEVSGLEQDEYVTFGLVIQTDSNTPDVDATISLTAEKA